VRGKKGGARRGSYASTGVRGKKEGRGRKGQRRENDDNVVDPDVAQEHSEEDRERAVEVQGAAVAEKEQKALAAPFEKKVGRDLVDDRVRGLVRGRRVGAVDVAVLSSQVGLAMNRMGLFGLNPGPGGVGGGCVKGGLVVEDLDRAAVPAAHDRRGQAPAPRAPRLRRGVRVTFLTQAHDPQHVVGDLVMS
jgi:hypothetical protein